MPTIHPIQPFFTIPSCNKKKLSEIPIEIFNTDLNHSLTSLKCQNQKNLSILSMNTTNMQTTSPSLINLNNFLFLFQIHKNPKNFKDLGFFFQVLISQIKPFPYYFHNLTSIKSSQINISIQKYHKPSKFEDFQSLSKTRVKMELMVKEHLTLLINPKSISSLFSSRQTNFQLLSLSLSLKFLF